MILKEELNVWQNDTYCLSMFVPDVLIFFGLDLSYKAPSGKSNYAPSFYITVKVFIQKRL